MANNSLWFLEFPINEFGEDSISKKVDHKRKTE
jgi:hypothetical protein